MNILVDMNLTPLWVSFFNAAHYNAKRWSEVGRANDSDQTISDYARENDYLVFTHDQDFATLLAYSKNAKPSVIILRTLDLVPEHVGSYVLEQLENVKADLVEGAVVIIEDSKVRVRPLPM
jgi:predicted nuclease of predicted toxin-antitoxin system